MAKFGGTDILYIALGTGAIYAIYKFSNSLTGGVQATGDAVGTIAGGIASPYGYIKETFSNIEKVNQAQTQEKVNAYNTPEIKQTIQDTIGAKETGNFYVQSTDTSKKELNFVKSSFNTKATEQALSSNYNEVVQRKAEYGFGGDGWFSKTFMPTTTQANIRVKQLGNFVNKIVETVTPKSNPMPTSSNKSSSSNRGTYTVPKTNSITPAPKLNPMGQSVLKNNNNFLNRKF